MLALARRLALASLLVAGCSGDDDRDDREQEESAATGDGDAEPSDNPAEVCGKGKEAFAKGLSLRDFAIYQAVKIDVIKDRVWTVDRAAPIVQGKKALVRVFVTAQEGWQPRRVNGVLTLDNGTGPKYLVDDFRPEGDSKDTDAASTLNFDVDAADIGPNTQFSISITEQECSDDLGTAAAVRFPTQGMQALGAEHIGKLRVVVVPVKVNGLMPDMSDDHLAKMREQMLAMYPVPDVEVSWREPLDWPYEVQAFGEGWTDVLNEIGSVRDEDGVDDDVY
jgi:hypothetical protein